MVPQKQTVMQAYRIRIKSGNHAGRYVGSWFWPGRIWHPDVQQNPPVNIHGTKYGLWVQTDAATRFVEKGLDPALEELTKLGYDFEVLKVHGYDVVEE
jgi:hypothetical protein